MKTTFAAAAFLGMFLAIGGWAGVIAGTAAALAVLVVAMLADAANRHERIEAKREMARIDAWLAESRKRREAGGW